MPPLHRLPLLFLLTACGDGFAPGELGAVRFTPPPSYRLMWERAQSCSGRSGEFARLTWWVVPGVRTFEYAEDEPHADGLTDMRSLAVTLAGGALSHPMVVRHEMLHALGIGPDHPEVPFQDPCRATWRSWDSTEARLELPPELAAYAPARPAAAGEVRRAPPRQHPPTTPALPGTASGAGSGSEMP